MGTSQSAIARIESAQENITLETLQRMVVAMKGRFYVSIEPQEYEHRSIRPWWDLSPAKDNWSITKIAARKTLSAEQLIVGLERPIEVALSAGTLTAETQFIPQGTTSSLSEVYHVTNR